MPRVRFMDTEAVTEDDDDTGGQAGH